MKKTFVVFFVVGVAISCGQGGSGLMPIPNPLAPWEYACQSPLSAGAACELDGDCASGLHCSTSSKKCTAALAVGGACESNRTCQSGLFCKGNTPSLGCHALKCDASGNNCQQGAATGKACPCGSNEICVLGPTTYTCQPPAQNVGDDCGNYNFGGGCANGLLCQIQTTTCQNPPGVGQPCPMPIGGQRCPGNLTCISDVNGSTCQTPVAIGGSCGAGGECVKGAHCNLSRLVCEANKRVGDRCQNGNECGEAPFDTQIGVDCVRGTCIDTSQQGAKCWPNDPSQCTNGRVCRKN